MPHVDDNFGNDLPTSPPRDQEPIQKGTTGKPSTTKRGLLPTLSLQNYRPDQRLVDEALGLKGEEPPRDQHNLPRK